MAQHSAGRSAPLRLPPAGVFICLVVITLTFLGLVALFSASQAIHDDPALLLRKQLIWLVIASFAGAFVMLINLEALRPLSYVLAGAALLSLVAVLIPGIGVTVNGAQRWIDFGPMRLQVSEIGKLGLLF
ncbi:MAG: FtsW/RodA/SpoVE family cell cycle protein, partial [Opitutales bacterium]